jgi:prevent-host-death family protein
LQDAKNELSVVDAAAEGVPQIVTRRGLETAIVTSYAEYERLSAQRRRPVPSLSEYLLVMPTTGEEADEFDRLELTAGEADL